jgi:hypothetical protein
MLPMHLAAVNRAGAEVIEALLRMHPEAAGEVCIAEPANLTEALLRDDPELVEVISEAEVIEALLREDPETADEAGQDGANKHSPPPYLICELG